MNTNTSPTWIIYSVIAIGFLGISIIAYWMMNPSSLPLNDIQDTTITETNNIINETDTLPMICTQTLSLLNCMISAEGLSGDKEGINQYYQKLISERNITTDDAILATQCTQQYNYIQGLQVTGYQTIIQSCMSK